MVTLHCQERNLSLHIVLYDSRMAKQTFIQWWRAKIWSVGDKLAHGTALHIWSGASRPTFRKSTVAFSLPIRSEKDDRGTKTCGTFTTWERLCISVLLVIKPQFWIRNSADIRFPFDSAFYSASHRSGFSEMLSPTHVGADPSTSRLLWIQMYRSKDYEALVK